MGDAQGERLASASVIDQPIAGVVLMALIPAAIPIDELIYLDLSKSRPDMSISPHE